MTENEAIEILTEGKSWLSNDRNIDAFCMGIQALEEIQQYRAIGTVEEFKALKEKAEPEKMKCRYCSCAIKGFFESKPDAYVCIGVKVPFVIGDYENAKCTVYENTQKQMDRKGGIE